MRALIAAGLAIVLALPAAGPHVHVGPDAEGHCAVCVTRHADVPRDATPDLTPLRVVAGEVLAAPDVDPVTGAPLGAIPGQSPPVAA
jgi:hypothetical protein